jgi:branched-chain amino acid transport system permease protein
VFVFTFSVVVSVLVWLVLVKTRVGVIVRASTERPELTNALGIDVRRWVTPVFGFGIALAGLAGVLAAPMRAVNSSMGADLIIAIFAVVVIGGLGSVFGSVAAGYLVGMLTAVGNMYLQAFSQSLVFVLMAVVLLLRPAGLFGREEGVRA